MDTMNVLIVLGLLVFIVLVGTLMHEAHIRKEERRHIHLVNQSMCPMIFSRELLSLRWLENYIRNGFDNYVDKHRNKDYMELYRAFWDGCLHITYDANGNFSKVYVEFNRKNYLSLSENDVAELEKTIFQDYPIWSSKIRLFMDTDRDEQYGILGFETMYAAAKSGDVVDRGPVKFIVS